MRDRNLLSFQNGRIYGNTAWVYRYSKRFDKGRYELKRDVGAKSHDENERRFVYYPKGRCGGVYARRAKADT